MIGTVVGNYRILSRLGAGAMGCVYFAEHTLMGRKAAVKMIHAELADDPETLERFVTEARSVNDIRHPNIVEVTDLGQLGDNYYLIMELLEGETLGERLGRVGVLSPEAAAHIVAQVAAALSAAHERGFVHRDLKPQNIFLTAHPDYPDYVKVLDFGITKLMGKPKLNQTQNGAIMGTPYYMSPEQCMSDPNVDARSDVYALGVVLYELVTGTLPFTGDALGALILAHINEDPLPPAELNPDVPAALSSIILKALAKRPSDRFATMRAMRDALLGRAESAAGRPSPAPIAPVTVVAPVVPVAPPIALKIQVEAAATLVVPAAAVEPAKFIQDGAIRLPSQAEIHEERKQRVANKLSRIVIDRIQANTLVLPTMPDVALKCIDLLEDSRHTASQVAKVLERDPLLAAQVLKAANSVVYGTARVSTLEQAAGRIGARQLRLLLVQLSVHRVFESKQQRIRDAFKGVWEHSLAVGLLARGLCVRTRAKADEDSAYLAGLLHDAGKPMVGALLLEAEKNLSTRDLTFVEDDVWIGIVNESHRDVGVSVAEKWRLPQDVIRAIGLAGRYDMTKPRSVTNVVCLANALAKRLGYYIGVIDARVLEQELATGTQLFAVTESDFVALGEELSIRLGAPMRTPIGREIQSDRAAS